MPISESSAPSRYLLLTGDDFGRSHEVNEAVERWFEAGALTQASLMVNEPQAEEAARIARRHPGLCVGLHLTLCDGSAARLSALTDARGSFEPSPARAGWRYALRGDLEDSLRDEIERQFAAFRALGFEPGYWDGHAHLHLHPTVLRLTLPIARRYGFHVTRLVREPSTWALFPLIFRLLSRRAVPALDRAEVRYADHVFGLARTGRMDRESIRRVLQNLPPGWSELYLHPGAETALPAAGDVAEMLRTSGVALATAEDLWAEK
jgi:hopanoid biosynthesis associated protein HpnK